MRLAIWLLIFLFAASACSPSQTEIEKQEQAYDQIADSVLKSNMPVDSVAVADSASFKK